MTVLCSFMSTSHIPPLHKRHQSISFILDFSYSFWYDSFVLDIQKGPQMSQKSTSTVNGIVATATTLDEAVNILQSENHPWVLVHANAILADSGEDKVNKYLLLIRASLVRDLDDGDSDTLIEYIYLNINDVTSAGPATEACTRMPVDLLVYLIEVPTTVTPTWFNTQLGAYVAEQAS